MTIPDSRNQPGAPGSDGNIRRRALFALFLVSAFNYVDRTILSILQIPIKADLGLSDGQLGALTGLSFALFYATLSLPVARLADPVSRRLLVAASLAIWSAMTGLSGLAIGFGTLVFFRIGVAIGESGSVPASVSLLADYYPPQRRATAMSLWGLALPVGLMLGYSATGWLAGINAVRILRGQPMLTAPVTSAIGALCRYVSNVDTKNFQPVNITFALLEPLADEDRRRVRRKRDRHELQVNLALKEWDAWLLEIQNRRAALQFSV